MMTMQQARQRMRLVDELLTSNDISVKDRINLLIEKGINSKNVGDMARALRDIEGLMGYLQECQR